MGSLYQFPEGQILAFALVLIRVIAFVTSMPILGTHYVPVTVKLLFSILLSMLMFSTITIAHPENIAATDNLILMVAREAVIGIALGFLMRMFFFAISMSAELVSISLGLNSAQMFNPGMGATMTAVEEFEIALATMFFLSINGHHLFIAGFAKSFELVPIANLSLQLKSIDTVVELFQHAFLVGLKMGAPVMIAIFFSNVTMGVLGRAVPQINVLVTSFPVTILVGVGMLILVLPLVLMQSEELMGFVNYGLTRVMKGL